MGNSLPIPHSPLPAPDLSFQNLEPVKTEEMGVVRDRAPAHVGVMIEYSEPYLLYLSLVVRRRAGVIDDPVAGAFAVVAGVADEDHHVVRECLNPGLMKEEQVAAPCLKAVAADERGVVIFERARVGEFGEFTVGQVRLPKRPEIGAKELFAERTSFEVIGFHVGRDGLIAFGAVAY